MDAAHPGRSSLRSKLVYCRGEREGYPVAARGAPLEFTLGFARPLPGSVSTLFSYRYYAGAAGNRHGAFDRFALYGAAKNGGPGGGAAENMLVFLGMALLWTDYDKRPLHYGSARVSPYSPDTVFDALTEEDRFFQWLRKNGGPGR